ncbi:MAG: phosphatase PAP2 family protein [Sphingobacteriales bacterium]|nr:phosphatase PAP2 family protein [Sphingobacteriales bacterium]
MPRIYRCLFVVLCFLVQTAVQAQNADINLLKSINNNESSFKNSFFKADAQSVTIINIAAPAALFIAGELKHNKQLKKDALYMTGAFVLSSVITQATKRIVKRERPFDKYSFIVKRSSGGGYSFPSGHTSAAFTTATSLSLLFPKWYVVVPAFLWAGSVGYARMYQGVHYPSDVLTGALVGAGSAWLGWKVQKWMDHKHHTKK